MPVFNEAYPEIEVRLRLSDHRINILEEGIDVAFALHSIWFAKFSIDASPKSSPGWIKRRSRIHESRGRGDD